MDFTEQMLVTSVHSSSTYDKLHGALLHPGQQGMAWHRQFTPGAAYTNKDAATPRPLRRACVEGSMRQHRLTTFASIVHLHTPSEPSLCEDTSRHLYCRGLPIL